MTPKEALIAARELLSVPERWCKGVYRNSAGACCAIGALARVTGLETHQIEYSKTAYALRDVIDPSSRNTTGLYGLFSFNDAPETTHADILEAFDRAIRYVEGEPGYREGD